MKSTKTTHIHAPRHIVFPWLEDDERLRQWIPNIIEDEAIIDTPERVGSTFRQVFLERGKPMEMLGEITAYRKNEQMRVYMTSKMFDLDADYILKAPSPEQTELTQETKVKFKGGLKLFSPFFFVFSKLSKSDPQDEAHAKLKACVEAEYAKLQDKA